MGEFTREELGERGDVPAAYVDALVQLGILRPLESGVLRFTAGDLRRVRFVRSLEQGGLSLEGVGTAVRNGDLSLTFLDSPAWQRFGGLEQTTYREVSAETGIPLELLQAIREAMGFARPGPDDRLREDEPDLVEWMKAALQAGANPAAAERLLRIWGESARQMAHAGTDWFHAQFEAPLLNAGMSEGAVMDKASRAAAGVGALVDQVVSALYHAQSEHTWIANKVESVEATLERLGLHRTTSRTSAMCFLDLSGYTQLTEERGDAAAAEIATRLGELVRRSAHDHGGRPVKWLGDGVMIHFQDPAAAVSSVLEMVDRIRAAGLPPAHAGIAAGPVIFQDGDYFGRTVNTAARIASHASGGQVLVTDDVLGATADPGIRFAEIGLVELRGLPQPIRLHQANGSGSATSERST